MFHTAGAAYGRKKRRCVLRTPRHHADTTISPDIGNKRRIKLTARARASPVSPAPNTAVSAGAKAIPMRASTPDRKSTRLNSSHSQISYAVFCLKKKKKKENKRKLNHSWNT